MDNYIMYISLFAIFLLPGIMYAFMPYLTRKTESFGVTVTEEIYNSERMNKIRKKYTLEALLAVGITFLITMFLFFKYPEPLNIYIYTVALIVMLGILFLVYLKYHFIIKKLKEEEGWTAAKKQVVLTDMSFRKRKIQYSNVWFVIPLIITAATAYLTYMNYDLIPEQIAMNYDLNGNPTNFKDKSFFTVFMPTITQLLMIGLFIFINNIISKAKQQIDPADPENSAMQNEIFRRKWSGFIIVSGIMMILLFSVMQISFFIPIEPGLLFAITMGSTLVIVLGAFYLSFSLGQGGSRIITRFNKKGEEIDRDNDEHWKLGQFYFNPEDPAVFIEKRFGIGWTINFGSKKGIIYMGVLLIFIIGSLLAERLG